MEFKIIGIIVWELFFPGRPGVWAARPAPSWDEAVNLFFEISLVAELTKFVDSLGVLLVEDVVVAAQRFADTCFDCLYRFI